MVWTNREVQLRCLDRHQGVSKHNYESATFLQTLQADGVIASGLKAKMADHQTINPPMQPVILSMEVDDDDVFESEYRIRIGNKVKYLIIRPGTLDRDTLSFPLQSLSTLPYEEEWTVADISRDESSGDLKTSFSNRKLAGVEHPWHHHRIDCLELEKIELLTAKAFGAVTHPNNLPFTLPSPSPTSTANVIVIAKIARFEWEIPRITQETRAYQILEGSGLAPRFLGHIHENGRIVGFLLEKIEGRSASLHDLNICEAALGKLHAMRLLHGDVNRYNFLVTEEKEGGAKVTLLDFECLQENASPEIMCREMESLRTELVDESGRGGGFIFTDDMP